MLFFYYVHNLTWTVDPILLGGHASFDVPDMLNVEMQILLQEPVRNASSLSQTLLQFSERIVFIVNNTDNIFFSDSQAVHAFFHDCIHNIFSSASAGECRGSWWQLKRLGRSLKFSLQSLFLLFSSSSGDGLGSHQWSSCR